MSIEVACPFNGDGGGLERTHLTKGVGRDALLVVVTGDSESRDHSCSAYECIFAECYH